MTLLQVSPTYVMEQLPVCGCNVTKESSSGLLPKIWLLYHETGGRGCTSVHMKPTIQGSATGHQHTLSSGHTRELQTSGKPSCIWGYYDIADRCANCTWVSSHKAEPERHFLGSRPSDTYMLLVNFLMHMQQVWPIWHFSKYPKQPLTFPAWNYKQSAGEAQDCQTIRKGKAAEHHAGEHCQGASSPSTQNTRTTWARTSPHLYFRNYRNTLEHFPRLEQAVLS